MIYMIIFLWQMSENHETKLFVNLYKHHIKDQKYNHAKLSKFYVLIGGSSGAKNVLWGYAHVYVKTIKG